MKKIIIPLVIILLIAGGAGGYYLYNKNTYQETLENATALLSEQQENIESVQSELESFNEDSYLREGLTEEDIQAVEKKVDTIKDLSSELDLKENDLEEDVVELVSDKEDLKEKLSSIRAQLETQQSVNDLFEQETPAINGSEINEDVIIKENLETGTLEDLKETAFIEDEDISEWQIAINTFITDAENQLSTTATATAQVETLFKDGEVQGEVTLEAYDEAKSEVDKIQNETVKETLTADLDNAHAHIKDISMLSDGEIARRAFALYFQESSQYLENDEMIGKDTDFYYGETGDGGLIVHYSVLDHAHSNPEWYSVTQNGEVTFCSAQTCGDEESDWYDPKTGNIFTDLDDEVLNRVREDVSRMEYSAWKDAWERTYPDSNKEVNEELYTKWYDYMEGTSDEPVVGYEDEEDDTSEIQEYEPDEMPALNEDEEEFFEG